MSLDEDPTSLERSHLAKVALAAWVGVKPDQLPPQKMWIEHPNHDSRQAWDRVIAALFAEFRIKCDDPEADATDCAHPAFWRGSDAAVDAVCGQLEKILGGEPVHGVNGSARLQALRERVGKLVADLEVADAGEDH